MARIGRGLFWSAGVLLAGLFGIPGFAKVEVRTQLSRPNVAVGDQVQFSVSIVADEAVEVQSPRLPSLRGLQMLGMSQSQADQLQPGPNGLEHNRVLDFHFHLLAVSAGDLEIPSFNVYVNGRDFPTLPMRLRVSDETGQPGPQAGQDPIDDLEERILQQFEQMNPFFGGGSGPGQAPLDEDEAFTVQLEVDKTKVYQGEQLTAKWFLYTPGQVLSIDTLKYPSLTGFWKEDIEVATRLNFSQHSLNGRSYQRALLASYALFPMRSGKAELDPYKARCRVATPGQLLFGRPVVATKSSAAMFIEVQPLPSANRPTDFTGGVGQFEVTASLEKNEAKANEPFAVNITFQGQGNAKVIELGQWALPPSVEVYEVKKSSEFVPQRGGTKTYRYLLLARQEGDLELPSLTASFFDPERGVYYQKETTPLKLRINPGRPADPLADKAQTDSQGSEGEKAATAKLRLPGPSLQWSEGDSFGSRYGLALNLFYSLVLLVLLFRRAANELGWFEKRRDARRRMREKFKVIYQQANQGHWRLAAAEVINVVSFVLSEVAEDEGVALDIEKMLTRVAPSLRRSVGKDLLQLTEQFQRIAFAPESLVDQWRDRKKLVPLIKEIEALLDRALALGTHPDALLAKNSETTTTAVSSIIGPLLLLFCFHFVLGLLAPTFVFAEPPQRLSLSMDTLESPRWMYGEPLPRSPSPVVRELIAIRKSQLAGRYVDCSNRARTLKGKGTALRPWLGLVRLDCSRQELQRNPKASKGLADSLSSLAQEPSWFLSGSAAKSLRESFIEGTLELLGRLAERETRGAWIAVENVVFLEGFMRPDQRARYLSLSGDVARTARRWALARDRYERSLQVREMPGVRERLDLVMNKLEAPSKLAPNIPPIDVAGPVEYSGVVNDEEQEQITKIEAAVRQGDVTSIFDLGTRYLKRYPGGRRADWLMEQFFDAVVGVGKGINEQDSKRRAAIVKAMRPLAPERTLVIASRLVSRGYYQEALDLVEGVRDSLIGQPSLSRGLELAFRSAWALGDFSAAEKILLEIIQEHAGQKIWHEALYRLGILKYRQGDDAAAVRWLKGRLATGYTDDNHDLPSRYWLWRALQRQNQTTEATALAQDLMRRYPLTYYGLRARAELNSGRLIWQGQEVGGSAPAKKSAAVWLSSTQAVAWQRFQLLVQAGWYKEAQAELDQLPLPATPEQKMAYARLRSLAFDHFGASQMVTDLWSGNDQYLTTGWLRVFFPNEFSPFVETSARANGLDPLLVMALIRQESSFRPEAVSSARAMGLMQLMPGTAIEVARMRGRKELNLPDDAFDPQTNIQFGTSYLQRMMRAFNGHVPLALAAYNVGIGNLRRWLALRTDLVALDQKVTSQPENELWFDEMPWSETSFYVKAILRNWLIYQSLGQGTLTLRDPLWQVAKSDP